jgi:hypothetical protein
MEDANLHSPHRRLIELRIEHADLDNLIDRTVDEPPMDELTLRDLIAHLEAELDPPEPA